MLKNDWHKDAILLYVVVNEKMASKVISEAKKHGVSGATVIPGRGTVKNKWLNAIGVLESRKEIVIMGADGETARNAMDAISSRFHFEKPNRGIAFTLAMRGIAGTSLGDTWPDTPLDKGAIETPQWQLVTVIGQRGTAEDVVEAAQSAGCRGGTVIAGRGSGVAQTEILLGMEIEPEKDIVFMLAPAAFTPGIETAIDRRLDLEKPNHGIMFTQNILDVYGLYQESPASD